MTSNTTTRRTVLRGAAWTAPAVVVAGSAPALAASTDACEPTPVLVDWQSSNYTRHNDKRGTYTIPLSDGTTMTLSISSVFSGGMKSGGLANSGLDGTSNDNLRLTSFNIGGTGQPGLALHQDNVGSGRLTDSQVVTFSFDRPVETLSFRVTDIDGNVKDFRDAIKPSGELVATPATGIRLSRATDPDFQGFWLKDQQTATPNNDASANLRLQGTNIQTFTLEYRNFDQNYVAGNDRDQRVFLTDIDITVPPTGC